MERRQLPSRVMAFMVGMLLIAQIAQARAPVNTQHLLRLITNNRIVQLQQELQRRPSASLSADSRDALIVGAIATLAPM